MTSVFLSRRLYPAAVILGGWELAVRVLSVGADVLPPPSRIILELWQSRPVLQPAAGLTFLGIAAGLGLAAAAGLALGIAVASRDGRQTFPEILKVPLLALAPLLIAWFGWDLAPRVALAFLVALLPVAAGTIEALRSLPAPMQRLLRSAAKRGVLSRLGIELRSALPHFFRSLNLAAGFSFAAVVAGEFAGANRGLGHVALNASSKHDMPLLFATLAVMGVLLLFLQLLCRGASALLVRGETQASAGFGQAAGPVIDPASLPIRPGEFFSAVTDAGAASASASPAFVPCEPALSGWLTVIENILLPCRLGGQDPKQNYDRARWLMESLGLSGLESKRADSLTPEQAQRVCICRALVPAPSMLVLEDPFRILDSVARERLATDLELLWLNSRFTVMLVTGQVEEAVRLSDRVAVMSASPGQPPEILEIDLPRPRRMDSRTTPAIMERCARVRILLRARGLLI